MTICSTSVDDRAAHFYNLDCLERAVSEKVIKNPDVDILELLSPIISDYLSTAKAQINTESTS